MKNAIAILGMLLLPMIASAQSAFDGYWACTATIPVPFPPPSPTAYLAIISHADSSAVGVRIAPYQTTGHGYTVGQINGATFTGTDDDGEAFAFTLAAPDVFTASEPTTYNGVSYLAQITCRKIW